MRKFSDAEEEPEWDAAAAKIQLVSGADEEAAERFIFELRLPAPILKASGGTDGVKPDAVQPTGYRKRVSYVHCVSVYWTAF